MDLNQAQLDALVAIADSGSFEAAARALHVTPSAVSQRIRALEAAAGQVLVSRGAPCRPTGHGERLVQLGRQTRLLYDEARQAIGTLPAVDLPVAVNADSLATWFRGVLAEAAGWAATSVVLHVEDQAYSHELLRRGEALAAVTSEASAIQGCAAEHLGALRYIPAASPALAARASTGPVARGTREDSSRRREESVPATGRDPGGRHCPEAGRDGGGAPAPDWAAMPLVVFNEKDDLQDAELRQLGMPGRPPVVHRVPSSADYYEAVRLGLGWGMLPELQAGPDLASGALVRLPGDIIDVPLYWQRWRVESPRLAALTDAVRRAARAHLITARSA